MVVCKQSKENGAHECMTSLAVKVDQKYKVDYIQTWLFLFFFVKRRLGNGILDKGQWHTGTMTGTG
jgi:hypothetical protein